METQPAASARRSGLEWFRRSLFGVLLIGIAVAVLVIGLTRQSRSTL